MKKIRTENAMDKISAKNHKNPPETAEEIVNCYGTYEIQPTANTENQYPAIAQGFNKKIIKNDCENEERIDNSSKIPKNRY